MKNNFTNQNKCISTHTEKIHGRCNPSTAFILVCNFDRNSEQRYHEVENKYVAARKDANEAKNELDQLKNQQQSAKQREGNANATIRTLKEEKSVLDRQLVEAKKQLRKANEERDGAEKKCLQFIHELEQTKRTCFLACFDVSMTKYVTLLTICHRTTAEQVRRHSKPEQSQKYPGRTI